MEWRRAVGPGAIGKYVRYVTSWKEVLDFGGGIQSPRKDRFGAQKSNAPQSTTTPPNSFFADSCYDDIRERFTYSYPCTINIASVDGESSLHGSRCGYT